MWDPSHVWHWTATSFCLVVKIALCGFGIWCLLPGMPILIILPGVPIVTTLAGMPIVSTLAGMPIDINLPGMPVVTTLAGMPVLPFASVRFGCLQTLDSLQLGPEAPLGLLYTTSLHYITAE